MKKILCIALFSLLAFVGRAQFGAKGGVNFSHWNGKDEASDDGGVTGFYLGFYYKWACTHHFGVEPQLVFSTAGSEQNNGNIKDHLNFIDLTVLGKYTDKSGFFIGVGPELDFLVSAKQKESGEDDVDIKDDFKGAEISLAMALGYDMHCGFGLYGRYNLGLTKIYKDDALIKESVVQFGVRWDIMHEKGKKK